MHNVWRVSGAALALLIAIADLPEGVSSWQPWTTLSAIAAVTALVARERTRPLGAVVALATLSAVAIGAQLAESAGHVPFGQVVIVALLLADVAHSGDRPTVVAVAALAVATATTVEGLADGRHAGDIAFVVTVWALAMAVALAVRWRKQAEVANAERVRTAERERIARELHDVVAHHVSAIAMSAEGVRATLDDGQADVDRSLAGIHDAASTALDEMRQIVHILRDEEPLAVTTDLAELADHLGTEGRLPVAVSVADEVGRPPHAVMNAIFRIAREAVTNSRRHAVDASRILIDVRADERRDTSDVVVTITDDGSGATSPADANGFGLRGMAERAELIGGRCVSGPTPTGGWRVEARLPRKAGS